MAVKKANKKDKVNVTPEVEVEETAVEATETQSVETEVETPVDDEATTPEVEVEAPVEEEEKSDLEVDTSVADVDTSNKPTEKVKIRMRVDHKCVIAMERYDLKAGKTYVVPKNVKNILNKAGYLSPL